MQLRKLFMLMAFATVSACGGGGGGSQNSSNSSSSSVTNRSPIISVAPNQRVLEGSKTVVVISASDADGDALTYEISGDDKSVFLITADGTLVFEDSPDYEAPLDIDRDNVYSITINVSDKKATDSVSLLIEIIDGLEIRVIDSPMRGAEVSLIDANTGLSVDGLSPASTNEDGFVFFEVPEFFSGAQVVSRGGVDSFTNRPLPELMLKSEVSNNRSVVQTVNAITSLMVASQNSSNRQAILDVLGITIPLSDIFERDIWAEALEGRDDALQAQQVNAQLSLLFLVGGALNRSSSEEAINSLVSRLVSLVDANIPFSLSDPDTLQVLLESVDVDESVNQRIIMEVVDVLADIETLLGASALSPVSNDALQIIEVVQLRVPGSVAALVTGELVLSEFQALMTPVSLFEQVVVSNNSQDTDGDGLVDILDPDDDGDGVRDDVDFFPNNTAEALDTDRDGLGNNQDLDDDNDGIADLFDDLPEDATESIDSDGDGVGNNRDPDDDNDGVLDTFDDDPLVSSLDRDGDGVPDIIDAYPVDPRNYLDSDGDGVFDLFDVFPLNSSQVKALKFEFSGVVAAGYSEKIRNVDAIEPSPNNVLSIGPRKKSQKFTNVDGPSARFNSGPAGDVLLVDQSNVVTWSATGDEVSNVILSSETMFVVESMLSPDGKYLYLLSPKAIQDEIEQRGTQDIEVDNCQLYKVDLSDDTFLCLMDEGAPAIESSLTSITWRDDYLRRALSFRADGLAIADSSDGPLLLRQDGSYQMFNTTSREAPAGFVKNVGRIVWLDDHHIAIGSNIFPEDGGATMSYWTAFNIESGLEVAEIEADTFRAVKHRARLYTSGGSLIWQDNEFQLGDALSPVQDDFGNLWFKDSVYGLTLSDDDRGLQVLLGDEGTSGPNIYLESSTGTRIIYQDFAFTEGWVAVKYSEKARDRVLSIQGEPYTDNQPFFVDIPGEAGALAKLTDPDLWYYIRSGNEQSDVTIQYSVLHNGIEESREVLIPKSAITSFANYEPSIFDPSEFGVGYELLEQLGEGVALEIPNPEPEQSTFCLYEIATLLQRCAKFAEYDVLRTDYENIRNNVAQHFPESFYHYGYEGARAFPGVQNIVFGGNEVIVYFKDTRDHQYYKAAAAPALFMTDGDAALRITPVDNAAGESEVIAKTGEVTAGSQQVLVISSGSYDRGEIALELGVVMSSVVDAPTVQLIEKDTEIEIPISSTRYNLDRTQLIVTVADKSSLSVAEYSLTISDYLYVEGSSLRYAPEGSVVVNITQAGLTEDIDTDLDGIGNRVDTDDDGDGVPDEADRFPLNATESQDTDNDGVGNTLDSDDDNDGVLDSFDVFPLDASENADTDGDGIGDNADLDADGDGLVDVVIYDVAAAFGSNIRLLITNVDDELEVIIRIDDQEVSRSSVSFGSGETAIDISSLIGDQNAEIDITLTNTLSGYTYSWQLLADEDVLAEFSCGDFNISGCDNNVSSTGVVKRDQIRITPLFTDSDSDGTVDTLDAFPFDPSETSDTDGDGVGNNQDTDDDGDGVPDGTDRFPLDATESLDTDNDGVGDTRDSDDDNDGVLDSFDVFPLDALENADTDGDGIGDNADLDADGDGLVDVVIYEVAAAFGSNIRLLITNVDDELEVLIRVGDQEVSRSSVSFGSGETAIDISSLIGDQNAEIDMTLTNTLSGYTYSWQLLADEDVLAEFSCGDFNVSGCDNNVSSTGVVKRDQIQLTVRSNDTDADGVSDYFDSDDDNDGIADLNDADRLGSGTPDIIEKLVAGKLSAYSFVVATPSSINDVRFQMGATNLIARLYPDNTLEMVGREFQGTGVWTWNVESQTLRLGTTSREIGEIETDGVLANFITSAYEAVGRPQVELESRSDWEFTFQTDGQLVDRWMMSQTYSTEWFAVSTSSASALADFVLDVNLPVRRVEDLLGSVRLIPLTERFVQPNSQEWVGTWGLNGVLPDDDLGCLDGISNSSICGHLFELDADGTGLVRNRSFSWTLDDLGRLIIEMIGGGRITVTAHHRVASEVYEFLVSTQFNGQSLSIYSLGAKKSSLQLSDVLRDGELLNHFTANGFSVTNSSLGKRADGTASETFGFRLNTGNSLSNYNSYGLQPASAIKYRSGVWDSNDSSIDMEFCAFSEPYPITEDFEYPTCGSTIDPSKGQYLYQRRWDVLSATNLGLPDPSRYFLLETLTWLADLDSDATFEAQWEVSRMHFYDQLLEFDLNDVDGDGRQNIADEAPLDPSL